MTHHRGPCDYCRRTDRLPLIGVRSDGRNRFRFRPHAGVESLTWRGGNEPGRCCLAGPLSRSGPVRLRGLRSRRALVSRRSTLQQHTPEAREELYPLVMQAATRTVIGSRCVRWHRLGACTVTTGRAARPLMRVVPWHLCLNRRLPRAGRRHDHATSSTATGPRRRLRPPRSWPSSRGPLHAPRRPLPPGLGVRPPTRLFDIPTSRTRSMRRRIAAAPHFVSSHRVYAAGALNSRLQRRR